MKTSFVPSFITIHTLIKLESHKESWVANAYDNNICEPVRATAVCATVVWATCYNQYKVLLLVHYMLYFVVFAIFYYLR